MARKRKPLPLLENITIEAVAAEGKCITRVDDQVIFVPFCVPGDVIDLQVVKKKHKYCEAKVVRFIKKSDVRQEPMCEHFGICRGAIRAAHEDRRRYSCGSLRIRKRSCGFRCRGHPSASTS